MSSSSSSTHDPSDCRMWIQGNNRSHCAGNWTGINIATMVVSFILFWPIGLFILYWIFKGRDVRDLPQAMRNQWARYKGQNGAHGSHSDNVVFNEYQQTQYDRIIEIKEEIKSRTQRFKEYRANAKRRADEEEFNRFMDETPGDSDK